MQFNSKTSYWIPRCGIVVLNKKYTLKILHDGSDHEGRFILANIQLSSTDNIAEASTPSSPTTIATVLNIYGPASDPPVRSAFYTSILTAPLIYETLQNYHSKPTFVMGDFNYSYDAHRREDGTLTTAPPEWLSILERSFVDCFHDQKIITWRNGYSSSIIDHVYCSSVDHQNVTQVEQRFLSYDWTDHAILGISFRFEDVHSRGPGAWKANPYLARNPVFRSSLAAFLNDKLDEFNTVQTFSTPQQSWDWVKAEAKLFIKAFQLEDNNWRRKQIHRLQKKRNRMLRQQQNRGLYYSILETIDLQIGSLQDSLAEIEGLKAGKHWREQGEKSAGFLKRSATIREQQRSIIAITDPITGLSVTNQQGMNNIVHSFYTTLFTSEPVSRLAVEELFLSIPNTLKLTTDDKELLTSNIESRRFSKGLNLPVASLALAPTVYLLRS